MVVTNKVYTPEMFVEALTGKCEIFDGKDPITQIHAFLKAEGIEVEGQEFWDYPINEIEHILSEKMNVVLVDVSGFYLEDKWEKLFRWFEITGYEEKFQDNAKMLCTEYKEYFSISYKEFEAVNKRTESHKDLIMQNEEYIIKPFKDWYDILKEGRLMRHDIVRMARDIYAKGEDYLFAMRKTSNPDTPYISLEFNKEGMLMCIRKKDCAPVRDEKEIEFAKRFGEEILKPYILNKIVN